MGKIKTLSLCFILAGLTASAQNNFDDYRNRMQNKFNNYRDSLQTEYDNYRDEMNQRYAEYLQQAWERFNTHEPIPKPKEEKRVPPVVIPFEEIEDEKDVPVVDIPIPVVVIPPAPQPKPQPQPVAPIKEEAKPMQRRVDFNFYGTPVAVRFDLGQKFTLNSPDKDAMAQAWKKMASKDYNNTLIDCLNAREQLQLNDWAYLQLLNTFAKKAMGDNNAATALAAYLYSQSGYKMRLAKDKDRLIMMIGSDYLVYGLPYLTVDGAKYFCLGENPGAIEMLDAAFPNEQTLSLQIVNNPKFTANNSQPRTISSDVYPEATATICVNQNLLDFFTDYPTAMTGDNMMTRWALYANTPLDPQVEEMLYPSLREVLDGRTETRAVNMLLNLVQTGLLYEYDDKVWGHDRAFFAEESLYYPYCDCEDRSILFSHLVRDLVDLDVALIYYPGHLATAVAFTEDVPGDYILIDGRKFTIADPTYINAKVGRTMPRMDNSQAKAIVLPRKIKP